MSRVTVITRLPNRAERDIRYVQGVHVPPRITDGTVKVMASVSVSVG